MVSKKDVARAVSIMTRVSHEQLVQRGCPPMEVAIARWIVFYYSMELTNSSKSSIARFLSKHHATVIYGLRRWEEVRLLIPDWPEVDACFRRILDRVVNSREERESPVTIVDGHLSGHVP